MKSVYSNEKISTRKRKKHNRKHYSEDDLAIHNQYRGRNEGKNFIRKELEDIDEHKMLKNLEDGI